jgi:hypothetical protein
MKISIKKLQKELDEIKDENRLLRNANYELKQAEKDKLYLSNIRKEEIIGFMETANRNLMEIIRWKCNPETTKYPFVPEKGQFNSEQLRRGF